MRRFRDPLKPALFAAALLGAGALGWFVMHAQAPPDGPVPVVWGKQACAHCRMHVSEPAFAAQLHEKNGEVLHFDDPGCLFALLDEGRGREPHALWFHHLREDRWLSAKDAAFVPVDQTPMGFGLGAVSADEPGAMGLSAAARRAADVRERGREAVR